MDADPLAYLGLPAGATAEEIRLARRRLAKRHHPDHGGDDDEMRMVNAAAAAALRQLEIGSDRAADQSEPVDPQAPAPSDGSRRRPMSPTGVMSDVPSFTVEALPVETFEALLIVGSVLGDLLDDDPPYRLDIHLRDPGSCWCRLELVPDAGASTVSIMIGALDGRAAPPIEAVRDAFVDGLNELDWD